MIIDVNESQIRARDQVRAVLDGTQTLNFTPAERHEWEASVLRRLRYNQLRRPHRGLVLRYLRRFSGFSRAHCTRDCRHLSSPRSWFRRRG